MVELDREQWLYVSRPFGVDRSAAGRASNTRVTRLTSPLEYPSEYSAGLHLIFARS